MSEIERFFAEKLSPIYKAHYAIWVHWWPLWRDMYSGRAILRHWERVNLVQEGQIFLDYGSGTGSFAIPAAKIVGTKGKVYALDCFPRQLGIIEKKARKEGLTNIETILAESKVTLPDECIDVVWMCDVFHEIKERQEVLKELHRILRIGGVLAIYDSMKEKLLSYTEGSFNLVKRDGKFYEFVK